MTVFRVQMPDGKVARIEAADGDAALAFARTMTAKPSTGRGSADYEAEKTKAQARDAIRDKASGGGAWQALNESVGEPLPVMDEIRGGLAAAGNSVANIGRRVVGKPTVDSGSIYQANKDAENEHRAELNAKHPVASSIGGLLGGLATAPAKATAAVSTLAPLAQKAVNIGKAGLGGGLFSSLYSAADGEGVDRLGKAAEGFLPGAVWGAGLGVVGEAASPILKTGAGVVKDAVSAFRKPTASRSAEQAAAAVAKLAASRGVTPATVRAKAARYGDKPVMAAELMGREGVTNLAALGRRGGETPDALEAALRQRSKAAPERIMQDFTDATGMSPDTSRANVEGMVAKGRADAAPLYDEAYAAGGVNSDKLQTLANRPSMKGAMARAVQIAAEEGRDPTELGFKVVQRTSEGAPVARTIQKAGPLGEPINHTIMERAPGALEDHHVQVENPTAQTWDYVKRGLDDVLNGYRDPTSGKLRLDERGRAILETLNAFRSEVTDLNPAYRKALEHSGDYLSTQEALNRASGRLVNGTVRDFTQAWTAAKTPSAKEAFRAGIATDLRDLANRGLLKSGRLSLPGVQQKLEMAFGKTGAQQFLAKVEAEGDLARYGSRMMPGGGSPTHELGAAEADLGAGTDLARIGGKLARGNLVGGALDALGTGFKHAYAYSKTTGLPAEVRDEMGRIYMLGPDDFEAFLKIHQRNPKATIGQFFPAASLGGQLAVSEARQ